MVVVVILLLLLLLLLLLMMGRCCLSAGCIISICSIANAVRLLQRRRRLRSGRRQVRFEVE